MPRGLKNWSFEDIVRFLEQHYFTLAYLHGGSHHYYMGFVDGRDRLVEVQYHAGEAIKPKTLNLSIIRKSGIPEVVWLKWAKVGNHRLQKKIRYDGTKERKSKIR